MSTETSQELVVVLGMHRSGTSAIARALKVLGVDLGERFLPTVEHINAKGFWEDVDINALNIEMMDAINMPWDHLGPMRSSDVEILRAKGYLLRAVELLRQKLGSNKTFGFKDPRVAKVLPFWKEVFDHCRFGQAYILALRNPISVARSLTKRDGFFPEKSYLLWLDHVITSLRATQGKSRVIVDYDRLIASPDREIARVSTCLGLPLSTTELQAYKADFLDDELQHTVFSKADLLLDDSLPPLALEIYSALSNAASGNLDLECTEFENQVKAWAHEFERMKSALTLVDKLECQLGKLKQAATERDDQIAGLSQAITEREGQIAGLSQVVAGREGQIAGLSQAVAEREGQIASLNQSVIERDGRIASLGQATIERDDQIARLTQSMADHDSYIAHIDQVIADQAAQLNAILNSRSWKITRPYRAISQYVRRILGEGQGQKKSTQTSNK